MIFQSHRVSTTIGSESCESPLFGYSCREVFFNPHCGLLSSTDVVDNIRRLGIIKTFKTVQ